MGVRGLKLTVKGLTPVKVQNLYGEHLHSLAFRLVGEVFAALPVDQLVEFLWLLTAAQQSDGTDGGLIPLVFVRRTTGMGEH